MSSSGAVFSRTNACYCSKYLLILKWTQVRDHLANWRCSEECRLKECIWSNANCILNRRLPRIVWYKIINSNCGEFGAERVERAACWRKSQLIVSCMSFATNNMVCKIFACFSLLLLCLCQISLFLRLISFVVACSLACLVSVLYVFAHPFYFARHLHLQFFQFCII